MKIFFIIWMFTANSVFAEANDKYNNFELMITPGAAEYDLRRGKESISSDVVALVNRHYGLMKSDDSEVELGGLYSYVEYSKNQYFLMGRFPTNQDKFLRCRIKDKSTVANNNCSRHFLFNVDVDKGAVKRLDTHDLYEISHDGLIATGALQGYSAYGCFLRTALRAGDINLDGKKDIFMFGGVGGFGSDEGGQAIKTTLTIYDGSTKEKVFVEEVSFESFIIDAFGENDTEFQSVSWLGIGSHGGLKRVALEQGVRRFSKLFFQDYDNNGLLDIIVWRKEYRSRLKTDEIEGYKLRKTEFLRYEESDKGFVKQTTTSADIELWLNKLKHTWQDGFPKKSDCRYTKLMTDYSVPKLSIRK
jgi:hypothetical protein